MIKFKQFIQTLFENYHTTFNSFAKEFPDKEKEIATSINHFRKLQNTLQGDEKNIDWWAKQGWEKFNTFVQQNISKKTKSSLKKEQGDFYVLQDDSEWTILIPLDHQASCYHGAGTDWCISKQKHDHFYRYIFEDNKLLVFCIRKSDKNMWAILYNIKNNHQTEEKKGFGFDSAYKKDDSAIDAETFKTETGLNLDTINEWLTKKQDEILDRLAANRTKDYNYLYVTALRTHQKNSELENLMIAKKDSQKISEYTHTVLRNRWPEGEKIVIDEANKDFNALDNMSGNITFNMYFYEYKNIIKNDLPQEIKTKLLKFPSFCYMFANQYTEGSFPEGEPTISKDANLSYTYAINVIHKRFPAGEPIIAQNPNIAYNYAAYLIKGRFPKGEPAISTNSVTSFYYALNIINGRFPEGELAIKKIRSFASSYFYNFINEKGDDNDFEAWLKNKNQKEEEFSPLEEDYKTSKAKFVAASAPEAEVDTAISNFKQIQNRLTGDEKNIDWWAKQGWERFDVFVKEKMAEKTKSSLKKNTGDSIILLDNSDWLILIPVDHLASCYYGSGTDWCTTKANRPWFSKYFFSNNITLVYCLNKKDPKIKYALSLTKELISFLIKNPEETIKDDNRFKDFGYDNDIFNVHDTSITLERFEYNTKLKVDSILKLVTAKSNETYVKRTANKKSDITIGLSKLKYGIDYALIIKKRLSTKYENFIINSFFRNEGYVLPEKMDKFKEYVYKLKVPKETVLNNSDSRFANSLTYYK